MHYRIRSDTLESLKMQFYQNHLPFRCMIFSTTYYTLSAGEGGSFIPNMQTCHSLYWRKLIACVPKVFVIKSNGEPFLQSTVVQDVTCVSLFWSCSGFPHLPLQPSTCQHCHIAFPPLPAKSVAAPILPHSSPAGCSCSFSPGS